MRIAELRPRDGAVARFNNRAEQIALATYGTLVSAVGLSQIASSQEVYGLVLVITGIIVAWRGASTSCVIVGKSTVSTRSAIWTRRYALFELHHAEVAVGQTGFNGFGREYLVFHRKDGRDVRFKGLNCRPPKDPIGTSVVRRAAHCINERLQASQKGPPDSPEDAAA